MNGHILQVYVNLAEARNELELLRLFKVAEDDYEEAIINLSDEILDLQNKVYQMYLKFGDE